MGVEKRKPDRRIAVTRSVIKDAMLALLQKDGFDRISVAELCREAGVGRATFYTHYTGMMDVIDELADDAIGAAEARSTSGLEQVEYLAGAAAKMEDSAELAALADLLPLCQRVAEDARYKPLFRDGRIAEYIIMRVYRQERAHVVPEMMREIHISERQAELIFLYSVMGAFAVNRALRWNRDETWYEMQRLMLTYAHAGNEALRKLNTGRKKHTKTGL